MGIGLISLILLVDFLIGFLSGFLIQGKANSNFWNMNLATISVFISLALGLLFYFKFNTGIFFIDDIVKFFAYGIFLGVLLSLLVLIALFTFGVYLGNKAEKKFK